MTARFHRLPSGGRINRQRSLAFTFNGAPLVGFEGDTLASALLANNVMLVGRSFKYHRPRGIYSAGVEEPNGLFTIGTDNWREPNCPGPATELLQGHEAESQNHWPSLRWDLMAINSLAGPLLSAGFYYKTFMGPTKGSWMFYEPFIRRAAGLGEATYGSDPDRYDSNNLFTDVLVIGSGPAGLAAAIAAGRAGARVIVVEQDIAAGGSILGENSGSPAAQWLADQLAELQGFAKVSLMTRSTAFGVYDGNTIGVIERREHLLPDPGRGEARQVLHIIRAKSIVFATGAIERPLVFNDNDRPGVMLAGAARVYLNRFAVVPGKRAVIATNNDSAYRTAFDLAAAGLEVTLADLRAEIRDDLRLAARERGLDLLTATAVAGVSGRMRADGALLAEFNPVSGAADVMLETRPADIICTSGGWSPSVHLTSHLGVKPTYRSDIAAFVQGPLANGQIAAGAVRGTFGHVAAVAEGADAGRRAAAMSGHDLAKPIPVAAPPEPSDDAYAISPIWAVHTSRHGKAFVDLQNDVTTGDIRLAHREGYQSVEHLKRYTTLGMGTDQGKTANINALMIMAGLRDVAPDAAGTTTFRPPYTPIALGALAGRNVGAHFRPVRRSPLHDWHVANGATMIEAGPWLRAWYYSWAGTTAETAYVEEMRLVRSAVGIADVSTLGKIDVQGPDAAEFLNRVYVNGFAKLPIGRARYGIMLSDDGTVFDDGTTTRLGDQHYFMTTTTAGAGEVMSWLEYLLQTSWTDLKVSLASLTDEWAGMAISGPQARRALDATFPGHDFSGQSLPYMGCLEFDFDDVPIRILRLSFSGELAYEVYTPADHGISLWERFLDRGRSLSILPYGLEALASLRIEKGHVAGIELDHRNTLHDLGLGKMASTSKPFVGRELLNRPKLVAPDRWSLVGLECLDAEKRLRGGSILFAADDEIKGHGRGYITSVTWSVELNRFIALALYEGGQEHVGEEIVCAFPLKNEQVRARIVSPHFVDPRGDRLNA